MYTYFGGWVESKNVGKTEKFFTQKVISWARKS